MTEYDCLLQAFRLAGYSPTEYDHAGIKVLSHEDCAWFDLPKTARWGIKLEGGGDLYLFDGDGCSIALVKDGPVPRITTV